MRAKLLSFIAAAFSVLTLTGCNGGEASSSPSSLEHTSSSEAPLVSSDSSVDAPVSTPEEPYVPESFEEPDINEIYENGSAQGKLEDIVMNFAVRTDSSFDCSFITINSDKTITLRSRNTDIVTFDSDTSSDGTFKLLTHNSGNAVIEIMDSEGMIVLRWVVRVRKPLTVGQVDDYLYSIDKFESIFNSLAAYSYEMTFTSVEEGEDNPATGYLRGSDEVDTGAKYEFSYTYESYLADWDAYYFDITTTDKNVDTTLLGFALFVTGDQLIVYYDSGGGMESLLAILVPSDLVGLHEMNM